MCAADVRANYTLNEDSTVTVHNSCKDSEGKTHEVFGAGYQPSVDEPAKLKVRIR